MLKLLRGLYSKTSFLVLFTIVWVIVFAISHYGELTMTYGEFLFQTVIFSTMIAFLTAFCGFLARGGTRDHRELTDAITVIEI